MRRTRITGNGGRLHMRQYGNKKNTRRHNTRKTKPQAGGETERRKRGTSVSAYPWGSLPWKTPSLMSVCGLAAWKPWDQTQELPGPDGWGVIPSQGCLGVSRASWLGVGWI